MNHRDYLLHLDDVTRSAVLSQPGWDIFFAEVIYLILETYNPKGVALWFNRARSLLHWKTPSDLVQSAQSLEDLQIIREMALQLSDGCATMDEGFLNAWIEHLESLPEESNVAEA